MAAEFNLIGIAGPTNTGKTTLNRELGRRITPFPMVFSYDEYDLFPSGSEAMERELVEHNIINWEDPSLFDEEAYAADMERVKAGLPVVLQARSRESLESGQTTRNIVPSRLNIVEGVFLYHNPKARDQFDFRFYIDLPVEEMIRRRLARTPADSSDPWDQRDYIEGEMVKGTELFVAPQREHAHVILDGLQPTSQLADIVMGQLAKLGLVAS